jgi:hypothetical protein
LRVLETLPLSALLREELLGTAHKVIASKFREAGRLN